MVSEVSRWRSWCGAASAPSPSANDQERDLHEMSVLGSLHVAAAVLALPVAAIVLDVY
jgi:hypothetical protein